MAHFRYCFFDDREARINDLQISAKATTDRKNHRPEQHPLINGGKLPRQYRRPDYRHTAGDCRRDCRYTATEPGPGRAGHVGGYHHHGGIHGRHGIFHSQIKLENGGRCGIGSTAGRQPVIDPGRYLSSHDFCAPGCRHRGGYGSLRGLCHIRRHT